MPKVNYPSSSKLSIYEFGRRLLEQKDLDPIYQLLWEAELPKKTLQKWLLAYWCFYHVGTASWITDSKDYWEAFRTAAGSKEYPRCHERRHFRGKNAEKSVAYLADLGVFRLFAGFDGVSSKLKDVMAYTKQWQGFGPWISFKIADMLERLALKEIDFDGGVMFLFDSPQEGAELLWSIEQKDNLGDSVNEGYRQRYAVDRILEVLEKYKAPPRFERYINVQEAETVLCKWKSYYGGHYKLGEDVEGCEKALNVFDTPTNRLLKEVGKKCLW